jgi:hypothetical protein
MDKKEISKICEAEFEVFSTAISKMGFDPQGFSFMILFDKKALSRKKLLDKFSNLTEEEKIAVENRIKLFS